MGFWDTLGTLAGKAAKNAAEGMVNKKEIADEAYIRAQRMDDATLIRKFKEERDYFVKYGYSKELKARGYGNDEQ